MRPTSLALVVIAASTLFAAAACTGDDPELGVNLAVDGGADASSEEGRDALSPDAPLDTSPTRISVAGRVISNQYGNPEDGLFYPLTGGAVAVYIGGKKVPPVGADGTFAVADVAIPYDAFVIEASASRGTHVRGYLGLTRPDPVLFGGVGGVAPSEAYTNGTLSPGPLVNDVALVAVGAEGTDGAHAGTSTSTYAQSFVRWASEVAPQVRAAAYTLSSALDLPTEFHTFGISAPFTPVAGGAAAVKDIALNQIFSGSAQVTITLPPAYKLVKRELVYRVTQGPTFRLDSLDPTVTTLSFAVPSNAAAELHVTSVPESATGNRVDTVDQILRPVALNPQTLKVPSVLSRITAPPANATIASGTPLTWTATSNGIYRFLMRSSAVSSADDVVVVLTTASTSVQMPDLSALGVKLTAGDYATSLTTLSPFTSVDAICGSKATMEFQTRTFAPGTTITAK